ncbi:DUF4951 domain-containing protein [Acinetobacter sp. ANC 4779]|uniref:DUF4951 domain-containing protein n=1 Tax=Acinetobacter sp. ANC 4779 TaxID=2529848 RepID=UPI001040AEFF|nr:DUF4951 domain-containing protein [Acinetobacter sp. ANC 4779]TCB46987.1 DUF4951 domain-containing protein [Acinetobacter sp. ANC 4779]
MNISEKIQSQLQSLVKPNIQGLEIPSTPNNMKLPEFDQGIIGWRTGSDAADVRLNYRTKKEVEKLTIQQVALEIVQSWQKFYDNETRRNAGNPAAPFRAQLIKKLPSFAKFGNLSKK